MSTQAKNSVNTLAKMTIHIDGHWSAMDYAILFDSIERVYNYYTVLEYILAAYEEQSNALGVDSVQHNFPLFLSLRDELKSNAIKTLSYPFDSEHQINVNYWFSSNPVPLMVNKIQYASPGAIDFVGIGKVFEIIRDIVFHCFPNQDKKLDLQIKEQEIIAKKIINLKNMGLSNVEVQNIIGLEYGHIDRFRKLTEVNKISNVEIMQSN